jgi:hypothetical protein
VDPRSAKSRRGRGSVGPQARVGNRCQGVRPHHEMLTGGIGESGFGVLKCKKIATGKIAIPRSPITRVKEVT